MDVDKIEFHANGQTLEDRLAIIFDFADGSSEGKARAAVRLATGNGYYDGEKITKDQLSGLSFQQLGKLVKVVGDHFADAMDEPEDLAGN